MAIEHSSAFAALVAKAYTGGVETSISELAQVLGMDAEPKLQRAVRVVDVVRSYELELVPDPSTEEFDTTRVLRGAASSSSPVTHVQRLLQSGEGPAVEFKSSMLCAMHEWKGRGEKKEYPSLPGELLKTVCAFLNTDGGDLLVGVDNDAKPCEGISLDLELRRWDLDKWQLHFQSLLKDRFYDGAQIQPYVRSAMLALQSLPVFHVAVMPRSARSFVQREKGKPFEYFIRNGPRTDSLDLPSFYAHITAGV
jgi:hypothetical protein